MGTIVPTLDFPKTKYVHLRMLEVQAFKEGFVRLSSPVVGILRDNSGVCLVFNLTAFSFSVLVVNQTTHHMYQSNQVFNQPLYQAFTVLTVWTVHSYKGKRFFCEWWCQVDRRYTQVVSSERSQSTCCKAFARYHWQSWFFNTHEINWSTRTLMCSTTPASNVLKLLEPARVHKNGQLE